MFRNVAFVAVYVAVLLVTAASAQATQYGTAEAVINITDNAMPVANIVNAIDEERH